MARTRGEGTTYLGGDGRWVSEVTIGWKPNGAGGTTRIRRRVFGATAEEASTKRVALLAQHSAGLPIPGGQFTVETWMLHWLDVICPTRVRASTLRTYRSYFETWIRPAIGRVRLRELRAEHLDALYAHMAREGRAGASQLQVHRIITRSLKVAMQREHIARNVGELVDPPRGPQAEPSWLSPAQLKLVLNAAAEDPLEARWVVAIALGLRQGEVLGLCWDAIDWNAGTLHVSQQLIRVPGASVAIGPLKTRSSDRVLAMPPTLVKLLRAHRRRQLEERLAGSGWGPWISDGTTHDLVFAQTSGRPIDHARDYRNWRALLVRASVPPMPLHAARHTTATMLLLEGIGLVVTAGFLGHGSTRMTERYVHAAPELSRTAASAIEVAMNRR